MKNRSLPFFVLSIIHGGLLIMTFYKKKSKTFLLLNISIGIGYIFEYFVLNVFKMYKYCPNIFKNKWIDSVFGALLSQSLFIPISATLLIKGWGRVVVSLLYGGVERCFIKWGIFENYTWSTTLTVTTMPFFFNQVRKWWESLLQGNSIKENISLFFCYWVNYTNILYFCLALLNKYRFRIGFVKDQYWEHFMIVPVYTAFCGLVGSISTIYLGKPFKVFGIILLHSLDRLLFSSRIIKPSSHQDLYLLLPLHVSMFFLGEYFHSLMKMIIKQEKAR